MTTLTLAGIPLPDLHWVDEFDWTPVAQAQARTESGLLVIEETALTAGRPITLQGAEDYAWATRAQVKTLYALQQSANASAMTLTVPDGRSFSVVWLRDGNTPPMTARPVMGPLAAPDDTDNYSLTLRLLTV